jgi:hypothetical protein
MRQILIALILMLAMSSIAIAEGDQAYGMMGGDCAECTDMPYCPAEVSYTDVSAASTSTATTTSALEEWAYGRRNMCPDGIEHVCWDFEEGSNLGAFKNTHLDIAVFETVIYTGCFGDNEPSYTRSCVSSGPNCRCKMYIYPCNTQFPNGTELPYINIVNGECAFSPRVVPLPDGCYWPGCKAFIGFKEDTQFVSFLASTHGTLYVRLYDHKGGYLGGSNITLSGPFNGWNIDDLIVGGEFGYLGLRRDYSYAAERMESLIGAPFLEFGIGYDIVMRTFYTAEEIKTKEIQYWNPETRELGYAPGIYDEGAIVWAFNGGEFGDIVNWGDIANLKKHDFTEHVDHADIQPGDVFFIDYPPADGLPDEVGIVVDPIYEPVLETDQDIIRIVPGGGVYRSSSEHINDLYDVTDGFVDYRSLPDNPKGGHSPYPKIPGKYII